jgi:hypothetical protein
MVGEGQAYYDFRNRGGGRMANNRELKLGLEV